MKKSTSLYQGEQFVFATMHDKELFLEGACKKILGASLRGLKGILDTDLLGTFSGEIEREGTQKETVLKKCLLGLEKSGLSFGLASEGSFGPDPLIPFFNSSIESIVFIDKKRDLKLFETMRFLRTNYNEKKVSASEDYSEFLKSILFPSHRLIVRPNIWADKTIIFKGIQDPDQLKKAISISCSNSSDQQALLQTDMRAHMNPTRALNLVKLGLRLFRRIERPCPSCNSPGWGPSRKLPGKRCKACYYPTELPRASLWCCPACLFEQEKSLPSAEIGAEPCYCPNCNP